MIVPVMTISNLVLTQKIYSEETNGAHAHNRDRVPLTVRIKKTRVKRVLFYIFLFGRLEPTSGQAILTVIRLASDPGFYRP